MKEYLFKNSIGEYKQVDPELVARVLPFKHWVEIPKGADVAVGDNGLLHFYNDQGNKTFYTTEGVWVECDKLIYISGEEHEFLTLQSSLDWKGTSIVWERETNKPLTNKPFTYDCLLGCYVTHKVDSGVDGHIFETADIGRVMVVVGGKFAPFGIFPEDLTFYTEDNQPLSFEQYKEMYYGATYNEETSQ